MPSKLTGRPQNQCGSGTVAAMQTKLHLLYELGLLEAASHDSQVQGPFEVVPLVQEVCLLKALLRDQPDEIKFQLSGHPTL